jgi:hypothetical protein
MCEQRPQEIRFDLGGWISGPCLDPDRAGDEHLLAALRDRFGGRWIIGVTAAGAWKAVPRHLPDEVVIAPAGHELCDILEHLVAEGP